MEWLKLLSEQALGRELPYIEDGRSQFQKDFDRIVFCSAFRKLQDKTQVFPLPESDYVHTRLTHSLEVSCVGRSLGNLVGPELLKRHPELKAKYFHFHFGEITAAACLAHDIGNPPFGHSGEDAIALYFKNGNGTQLESEINDDKKWADLTKFEGNAQGFRIITNLQNPGIKGGLQLSSAALAAFTKYPKESLTHANNELRGIKSKIYKKFSFFQSEKELFLEMADTVGLKEKSADNNMIYRSRHPLAFLVEAADDICYRIMDLEDGYRLSLLSFNETEEMLLPLIQNISGGLRNYSSRDDNEKISYLRAKVVNNLIEETAKAFLDNETSILEGKFENDLISVIPQGDGLKIIKAISIEKIYSTESVLEREAAGYEVLAGLLDSFLSAMFEYKKDSTSLKSKNLLRLLPSYKEIISDNNEDLYNKILLVTDYISGMTDSAAISLYRRIKGISLPGR